MTEPGQSAPPPPPPPAEPPHQRSEATRLLCAGVYFDSEFRRRVVEHLVEHEERPAAPSLGADAVPVLAHALRVRAREAAAGLVLLAVWGLFAGFAFAGIGSDAAPALGMPFPFPWFLLYAVVCFASWTLRGPRSSVFTLGRTVLKEATRGRFKSVLPVLPFALAAVYWLLVLSALAGGRHAWAALLFPVLLVAPVLVYRAWVVSVMRRELGRAAYAGAHRAMPPDTAQYRRITAAVDREQYARLVIYDPFRPFVGAGKPYQPWSIATELRPRRPRGLPGAEPDPAAPRVPGRLTGREVVDLIKPALENLRRAAADSSRDRLRALEVEEMVYLPAGPARDQVDYGPQEVRTHLERAVGEGAEARRHFLRVRIGAWDDQIEVSLLVRVHTQGGMLVLEVVPHVLTPPRPEYRSVDVLAAYDADALPRDALRGVLGSPAAAFAGVLSVLHTGVSLVRTWLTMPEYALPDAPVTSVRELASVEEVSLMQEMDISRYVKTLQDRITSGVAEALRAKGFETGEFEQYVVNVGGGGVFIGRMSGGAVATGKHSLAKHQEVSGDQGGGAS
jgi:hypothetical protein